MKTSPTMNVIEFFFPGPLYCCVSIKTVNNQTLSVFYWWLHNLNNLLPFKSQNPQNTSQLHDNRSLINKHLTFTLRHEPQAGRITTRFEYSSIATASSQQCSTCDFSFLSDGWSVYIIIFILLSVTTLCKMTTVIGYALQLYLKYRNSTWNKETKIRK